MARCRRWFLLVAAILSFAPLACRSNDLVENELRARDTQYREALEALGKAEARNDALTREMDALHKGARLSPELAAHTFGLKRIVLGRGTGGADEDAFPGDEAVRVVIEPRDHDDHTIKTPGTLHVAALEINSQGIKVPLSHWTIDPDKLRQSWKQGLLSTGYSLILPWYASPTSENVRIVARLVLPDGREFEADKDIKVRIVPGVPRREDHPPSLVPPPAMPGAFEPTFLPSRQPAGPAVEQSRWQPAPLNGVIQLGRPQAP